jgi:hypothetical protein
MQKRKRTSARLLVNNILTKGTIIMCYAPVILYVYSSVIKDCVCNIYANKPDI